MFHARQIWTIISTIAAMLTIMALNLYSQPLAAQTIVTLQDDYSISFLRGQFDDKKHQGEIFDVELFERGERFATADRLLLLSDRPLQDSSPFIRQFEADNLRFTFEDITSTIETLRGRNLFIGNIADLPEVMSANPDQFEPLSYQISNMTITNANVGIALFVPYIENAVFDRKELADGTPYFGSGSFTLPSLQIHPYGNGPISQEFQNWLNKAGLPHFELSLSTEATSSVENANIITHSEIALRVNGLFALTMGSDIHMSEEAVSRLSDPAFLQTDPEAIIGYLFTEAKLDSLTIDLRDLGALGLIEQSNKLPPFPIVAEQLTSLMRNFLPNTAPRLTAATEKFLIEGGALQLAANPASPFRMGDFSAALLMPDFVASEVNLTASHKP